MKKTEQTPELVREVLPPVIRTPWRAIALVWVWTAVTLVFVSGITAAAKSASAIPIIVHAVP